jgi:hypothetical protein
MEAKMKANLQEIKEEIKVSNEELKVCLWRKDY